MNTHDHKKYSYYYRILVNKTIVYHDIWGEVISIRQKR